jgi:hypothetical protein
MVGRIKNLCLSLLFICFLAKAQTDEEGKNTNATFESSNLPLIFLNTGGMDIPDDPKIVIDMGIVYNPGERNYFTDPYNEYNGKVAIELRGSSSSGWPKKNYSIETRFNDGSNRNVSLLGMPEENDWILHGPYSDKSLMRNALAYKLGYDMGRWTPRTRFCEMFINNEYTGVYLLVEKIKRDKYRLDLSKLNYNEISGDELTGGYIIKIDRPGDYWISQFTSPIGQYPIYFTYVYPDYLDMPAEQRNYIHNYVDEFEEVLKGSDFSDPETGYRKYIDSESFIDFFLLNELSRNVDAYRLSTFLYKDRDSKGGKLTMGPIWDFDLAFGNADYYDAFRSDGWMLHSVPEYDEFQAPFWWDRLRQDPDYYSALQQRWESLRKICFSDSRIEFLIDSMAGQLVEAQARNFERFPVLGTYLWPNYFVGETWESEVQVLKDWITDRIAWMDNQITLINTWEDDFKPVNANEISLFPNPFDENVTCTAYFIKDCNFKIVIYNMIGKMVCELEYGAVRGYNEFVLTLGNSISGRGLYLFQFLVDGKSVGSQKLAKL